MTLFRLCHWGLTASLAITWATRDELPNLHRFAGYLAAFLLAGQIAFLVRKRRFHRLDPEVAMRPLGKILVLAAILLVATTAFTGWLQTTDAFWNSGWLHHLHEALAKATVAALILHGVGALRNAVRSRRPLHDIRPSSRDPAPPAFDRA